jgi:dolichol-phosphate mannosyltransferase
MPELTVVVPTYNEAENIEALITGLEAALGDTGWEVIFVDDDSPDGTAELVHKLSLDDPRIRCLRRVGRRGLSSACIEGMLASTAPYLVVMDADLQHDESLLPDMLSKLRDENFDLVVGSRYVGSGSSKGGLSPVRAAGSKFATFLSQAITRQKLSDPMSGFFMLRREVLDASVKSLYGKGFKILLDIVSSHERALKVTEIPYEMRARAQGESKLDSAVVTEFLLMLLDRKLHGLLPARFLLFVLVGLTGVAVHMGVLFLAHSLYGKAFAWAQAAATFVAMTSNFFLNNVFTFRDRRLHGSDLAKGLISFYLACSIGALVNIALASFLFEQGANWALAGFSGAAVGAMWNFSMSSYFTWRKKGG